MDTHSSEKSSWIGIGEVQKTLHELNPYFLSYDIIHALSPLLKKKFGYVGS